MCRDANAGNLVSGGRGFASLKRTESRDAACWRRVAAKRVVPGVAVRLAISGKQLSRPGQQEAPPWRSVAERRPACANSANHDTPGHACLKVFCAELMLPKTMPRHSSLRRDPRTRGAGLHAAIALRRRDDTGQGTSGQWVDGPGVCAVSMAMDPRMIVGWST